MKEKIKEIVAAVSNNFRTFGGGKDASKSGNPIAIALQDKPAQFAAGVDVESVVEFVLYAQQQLAPSDEDLERLVSIVCDQFGEGFDGRNEFCKKTVAYWKESLEQPAAERAAQTDVATDETKVKELIEAILIIGARRANDSLNHDSAKELIKQHIESLSKRVMKLDVATDDDRRFSLKEALEIFRAGVKRGESYIQNYGYENDNGDEDQYFKERFGITIT